MVGHHRFLWCLEFLVCYLYLQSSGKRGTVIVL